MSIDFNIREQSLKSPLLKELYKGPRGSHHPTCNRYNDHIIRLPFTNISLCIGCTFMTLGSTFVFFLYFVLSLLKLTFFQLWIVGFAFFFSSIIQMKIKPKKKLKILLRFSLGISSAFFMLSIYVINWDPLGIALKVIGLAIFISIAKQTLKMREKRIDDKCTSCPEGVFPFCNHKMNKIKYIYSANINNNNLTPREAIFIDLIGSIIDQSEKTESNMVMFEKDFCEI